MKKLLITSLSVVAAIFISGNINFNIACASVDDTINTFDPTSNYLDISLSKTKDIERTTYYSTTYVYTPKNSAVEVISTSYTDVDVSYLNKEWDAKFPNATRIASASVFYNCHSYAWYSASKQNPYWMNYPHAYYSDGSFDVSSAKVGNIICYYSSNGENLHSGVITDIDNTKSGLSALTVTSKWGSLGVYVHAADYCPYVSNFGGETAYTIIYEHETHTFNNHYVNYNEKQHKSYCSCGQYQLSRHYAVVKNSVNDYEVEVIGGEKSKCAACGALFTGFHPGIVILNHNHDN